MEEQRTFKNIPPSVILSPQDILNLAATEIKNYFVITEGYVIRENGYTYLANKDNDTEKVYKITLENEHNIPINSLVRIEGLLNCYLTPNGGIYPRIKVKKFTVIEDNNQPTDAFQKEELENLLRKKEQNYGFSSYIEYILTQKQKLNVAVIHGQKAQTHIDFTYGFNTTCINYKQHVSLKYYEVQLTNDQQLAETIRQIADRNEADIIFIVRGGGDKKDLENIGGPKTYLTIASINIPVFLAIGHSLDKGISMLEFVSTGRFPTPTAAGVELGRVVSLICNELFRPKQPVYIEQPKQIVHEEHISDKQPEQPVHNQPRIQITTELVLLVLILILLLFLLLF